MKKITDFYILKKLLFSNKPLKKRNDDIKKEICKFYGENKLELVYERFIDVHKKRQFYNIGVKQIFSKISLITILTLILNFFIKQPLKAMMLIENASHKVNTITDMELRETAEKSITNLRIFSNVVLGISFIVFIIVVFLIIFLIFILSWIAECYKIIVRYEIDLLLEVYVKHNESYFEDVINIGIIKKDTTGGYKFWT